MLSRRYRLEVVGPEPTPSDERGEKSQNGVESDVRVLAPANVKDDRSPAAASGVSHTSTCTSAGTTRPTPASPSATPAKMRKPAGISNTYRIPLRSLSGDGRSRTVAWNTKKMPSRTRPPNYSECPHYGETRY